MSDGGPAFPRAAAVSPNSEYVNREQDGMSLRDYMATHILAAIVANSQYTWNAKEHAEIAYRAADKLLAARAKGNSAGPSA